MRSEKWIRENTASLEGKSVAISGATGGLGRELCFYLASLGAELILVDRNREKSHDLAEELTSIFEDLEISLVTADMADMQSVRAAAEELDEIEPDYLILNAGAYSIPRYKTDLGYDNVYQINFISPYYLARRLLPGIKDRGGRIVAVSSIAHNYSKIDERDIDFSTRDKASLVYGNAKRFLTYALYALDGESISLTHPGISFTGITNHYPPLIFALIKEPMKIIFMKPHRACLSILSGLFTDCRAGEWIGPWMFNVWGTPRKMRLNTATADEARKIAEIAEQIYEKMV
jgi:NAD(P)-dependent dehydrogenase (short-subunit alcohol dehydrogenase family)